MSNTAGEQILQIVEAIRKQADNAETEFDQRNREIRRKSEKSIDLFGGNAANRVVEIASDARRACDDLYASYQMLVRMLDEQCRPLLSESPSTQAVYEACKLIKWLNDESEIENNYTASLNNHDLGGIVSAKYIPSMENKMIQKYWETTFSQLPGADEIKRQEAEEQQRKRQREREARELVNQLRNEKGTATTICAKEGGDDADGDEALRAIRAELASLSKKLSALDADYQKTASACDEKIALLQQEIDQLLVKRKSLGLFKGKEKKAIDAEVSELNRKILSVSEELEPITKKYEKETAALKKQQTKLTEQRKKIDPQPGDIIKLGKDPLNPKTAIQWIVVAGTSSQVYLISKDILGYGAYKDNWENEQTYREWLCKFEKDAFTKEERSAMAPNPIRNDNEAKHVFVYTQKDAESFLKPYLKAKMSSALEKHIKSMAFDFEYDRDDVLRAASSRYWLHSGNDDFDLSAYGVVKEDNGKWMIKKMARVTNDTLTRGIRPAVILKKGSLSDIL